MGGVLWGENNPGRADSRQTVVAASSSLSLQSRRPVAETVLLDDLVAEALRDNRDIRAAQKKYEASRQHPSVVSSLPDPRLSLVSNNVGNPIPGTTLGTEDMSNVGFELMQDLPFAGKLQLQGKMARKDADADWQGKKSIACRP